MKNAYAISRRQFIATSTVAVLPVKCHQGQAADSEKGWIDAHVHVWTPNVQEYPLADGFRVEDMQPPSFTPQELFAHTRPAGVERIVLIQMSFYRYDNRYMLDVMAANPGVFSGVAIVDHRSPDVAARMKELARRGVRGFRIHAKGSAASQWVNDEGMAAVWQTAREANLAVCPLINPTDLPSIDALCARFPGTRVVVDHFARIGISGQVDAKHLGALCRLARFKNVYVKTSAFYALGKKQPPYDDLTPMIRRVVDAYGPSRLMWASDCPYQVQGDHNYESSIALIRDRIDFLSDADRESMLRGTAHEVFFS
jgi:predicted TIM-barrel fold metal-dependent hydrolase